MKQSTKNVLLIAGFSLVLLFSYRYSFSKTFEIKNELEELKNQISQNSGTFLNINSLEEKEVYLDSIIFGNKNGNTSLQNNLLKVLNEQSTRSNLKIISFKEPHIHVDENGQGKITSFRFVLEGEFKNLEEVLYQLETDYSFGSLSNINFERKKNYRMNKTYLQCSVMIQNIE